MSNNSALLEVTGLEVMRGGVRVLNIPSFMLLEHEFISLIGPNGAGKSTLLLSLARLIPLRGGAMTYRGETVKTDSSILAHRRRLAMVFQEPLLLDTTVFHNVATGLKIRGITGGELKIRVMESLDRFRVAHLAERSARKLSGGEAQRTSLARAFATRPEMILLDEPFVALDPPTRQAIMEDLAKILHETSTAAIIATHDPYEALGLSKKISVMKNGEIVQTGPTEEIMQNPADEFTASFVAMRNVLIGSRN
jgi:tungstate transport system ATP-binding protein